ncbi:MAG TPA: fibronectin type III domain-containing protein [Burkholderiales bacterium]|nr:fibronectin type III domain-containing protein [Burkholderiales bacterium]
MAARSNLWQTAQKHFSRGQIAIAAMLAAIAMSLAACGGGGSDPALAVSPDESLSQPAPPGTAILAWDAVTHPDLSGYRVYYGTASGQYLQAPGHGISVGNVTTQTLTGLSSATRYYFTVTSVDTSGNESGFSNEVFKDIS